MTRAALALALAAASIAAQGCDTRPAQPSAQRATGSSAGPIAAPPAGPTPGPTDTLWLFAESPDRDAVRAGDSEATLVRRYGRPNVRRDSVPGAEGESFYGTVLYPDDARRTLYVYWAEGAPFARPEAVRTGSAASAWVAWPGVAVGTTLADVERLNGRPFRLLGFEWDYGGSAVHWGGGRLGTAWAASTAAAGAAAADTAGGARVPTHVSLRFRAHGPTQGVAGEAEFSSALPAIRRADARVAELYAAVR